MSFLGSWKGGICVPVVEEMGFVKEFSNERGLAVISLMGVLKYKQTECGRRNTNLQRFKDSF